MKKLLIAAAAVLGVFLWLHRGVVHQAVVDTAIALAALAALCLAAAGVHALAGRRAVSQPARRRAVPRPAAARHRPQAGRPGAQCAELCGRPASRVYERWPVCGDCGSRLDASAARAAGRPHSSAASWPAGQDPALTRPDLGLPALAQPPALPAGETIGSVDMTEFEDRGTL